MIDRLFEKAHIPMIDQHWKMMWALYCDKKTKEVNNDNGRY